MDTSPSSSTTATIESVTGKEIDTARGKSSLYLITADGREYSTFDLDKAKHAGSLKGQKATLVFTTARKVGREGQTFENYRLTEIQADSNGHHPEPTKTAVHPITETITSAPNKDTQIARAVALKAAVDSLDAEATLTAIWEQVEAFESYLLHGAPFGLHTPLSIEEAQAVEQFNNNEINF